MTDHWSDQIPARTCQLTVLHNGASTPPRFAVLHEIEHNPHSYPLGSFLKYIGTMAIFLVVYHTAVRVLQKVSQEAYTVLEKSLSEPNPGRLARAANRLNPAAAVTGRQRFCAIPDGYSIQEVTLQRHAIAVHLIHPILTSWYISGSRPDYVG